jgi:hypothetical protein
VVLKSIFFWDMTPCSAMSARCFAELFYNPEDGGDMLHLNRLHGVTSQKMILFITTAVKTSNPP